MSGLHDIWGKTGPPADCVGLTLRLALGNRSYKSGVLRCAIARDCAQELACSQSLATQPSRNCIFARAYVVQGRTLQSMVCEVSSFTANNQMAVKRQQHVGRVDASLESCETFAIRTRVSPRGP
jgi:hypothetical protein